LGKRLLIIDGHPDNSPERFIMRWRMPNVTAPGLATT
jgi:hypothetical protein